MKICTKPKLAMTQYKNNKDSHVSNSGSKEWINSSQISNDVEAFVKLTTQQCYELLIIGHAWKCMVTLLLYPTYLTHSNWWLAALKIVYRLAKQISHSVDSQNTLQHSLNSLVSLVLFPLAKKLLASFKGINIEAIGHYTIIIDRVYKNLLYYSLLLLLIK